MCTDTLAVLWQAMSRVQIGSLGVCSFGAATRLLHSFDSPLTDANAAECLRQMTYAQAHTNVQLVWGNDLISCEIYCSY